MALDGRIHRQGSSQWQVEGSVRAAGRLAAGPHRDRLGDMYAEVQSEKDALVELRDEVAMSIQLGRLEMTREVLACHPEPHQTSRPSRALRPSKMSQAASLN